MKKVIAFLLMIVLLISTAVAESWTVFVVGFDFTTAEVILEDEDGYQWTCPFGESDWTLGEEYILVLEEGQNPEIWEIE